MKVNIFCSVPTVYQLSSISHLMGGLHEKSPYGGFSARITFNNKSKAITWLKEKAYSLYSNGSFEEWEYKEAIQQIKKLNSLTYDAATASIEIPEK